VFVNGQQMPLVPARKRRDPPGWRVSTYGARLSQAVAMRAAPLDKPVLPEHEI